jgi:hypothetical protein
VVEGATILNGELLLQSCSHTLEKLQAQGGEDNVVDIGQQVSSVEAITAASCVHTAAIVEAMTQHEKAVLTTLELQLTTLATQLSAPHHVDVAASAPPLLDVDDTFESTTIAFIHAQVAIVQDIWCLIPFVLDVSTHYAC